MSMGSRGSLSLVSAFSRLLRFQLGSFFHHLRVEVGNYIVFSRKPSENNPRWDEVFQYAQTSEPECPVLSSRVVAISLPLCYKETKSLGFSEPAKSEFPLSPAGFSF